MKSIRKIICSILFLCFAFSSFIIAQDSMEDVVYLKNGNVMRGIILEQIPNKTITLKINEQNIFTIKTDEIEKIVKESTIKKQDQKQIATYKEKGYINLTEVNFCYGISSVKTSQGSASVQSQDPTFGLRTVNGYQFNPYFTLGLGLGYEAYDNSGLIPITLDSRIMFLKKKVSPVLNINGGYSVGLNNSGGLYANPSIGLRAFLSRKTAFLFNIGYKLQQLTFETIPTYNYYTQQTVKSTENFNFLSFSLGVSF